MSTLFRNQVHVNNKQTNSMFIVYLNMAHATLSSLFRMYIYKCIVLSTVLLNRCF